MKLIMSKNILFVSSSVFVCLHPISSLAKHLDKTAGEQSLPAHVYTMVPLSIDVFNLANLGLPWEKELVVGGRYISVFTGILFGVVGPPGNGSATNTAERREGYTVWRSRGSSRGGCSCDYCRRSIVWNAQAHVMRYKTLKLLLLLVPDIPRLEVDAVSCSSYLLRFETETTDKIF